MRTEEGITVGIDLGTTNSLVAILRNGRPVVLENSVGNLLTPSAVSVDEDGNILVGGPARDRATTHPERTVERFKRDMGTDKRFSLGKKRYRPEELSAILLRELVEAAEATLGEKIKEAVVTVPAYFGDLQRQATRDAAKIAGLKVERIINEPTAAALAYGLHERERELQAVILDLGGGTFDITVLEIVDGVVEIQSSAGDARLGGEDFSDALLKWVEDAEGLKDLNAVDRARLRVACDRAKRQLGDQEQARIAVFDIDGRDIERTITRANTALIYQELLGRMRLPILRALRDAELQVDDIDEVLLVGGATRMREVSELVTKLFNRLPLRSLPPDEAVAMGAAIQAALKIDDDQVSDMVVTDVAPFTVGVSSAAVVGTREVSGLFSPILERGTCIPASRVERFFTMVDNQKKILIEVFQGEHSTCKENTKLGEYTMKVPPKRAGDVAVDVRISYDLNGIIEVEMNIAGSSRKEHLIIERNPGQMSETQVKKAREAMEKLKFHPRESLPNRTALSRAEAVYQELRGEERLIFGALLADFRGALETQDDNLIQTLRDALNNATQQFSVRR